MRQLSQADSKVEVTGFEAKYYDKLMDIITLGKYKKFIKDAIANMGIKKGDYILDMGAGTGRNALLMREYIADEGKIVALEIGKEMIEQFEKNRSKYDNIILKNQSIVDEPLGYEEEFDIVFISFVLHGFIQQKRDIIISNAYKALKKGGRFCILDYNNFDVDSASIFTKFAIRKIECPLAEDFIKRDTKQMLREHGFDEFESSLYFGGLVRLLCSRKGLK